MANNCTYSFDGTEYTRPQIIRLIKENKLLEKGEESASTWLQNNLGLSELEAQDILQDEVLLPALTDNKFKVEKAKKQRKPAGLKVGNIIISPEKKQEIFAAISTILLNKVFDKNQVYNLINANKSKIDITSPLKNSITAVIHALPDSEYEMGQAIYEDAYTEDNRLIKDSEFVKQFNQFFESYGGKLTLEESNPIEDKEGDENDNVKDYAFMKASFEFDPKDSMSKSIRLLLASLIKRSQTGDAIPSNILGLIQPVKMSEVSTLLLTNLVNLPADFDVYIDRLQWLSQEHPEIDQLIDRFKDDIGSLDIDVSTVDYDRLKFRNEFIQNFAKTLYDFQIGLLRKGNLYSIPAASNNVDKTVRREFKNNIIQKYRTVEEFRDALDTKNVMDMANALGIYDITEDDLKRKLDDNEKIENKIHTIRRVVVNAIDAGVTLQKLYDKNSDESLNIQPALTKIAKFIADTKRSADLNFRNAEGKQVYGISLNNYQTITINTLNWIGSKNISLDAKIDMVRQYLPSLLDAQNFRDNKITSIWINRILNGDKLLIGVYDGIQGSKRKGFSDLKELDLYAFHLSVPFEGTNFAVKHSSRSTIFTYRFADKYTYVRNPDYTTQLDQAVDILYDYYLDEQNVINTVDGKKVVNFGKLGKNKLNFPYVTAKDEDEIKWEIKDNLEKKIKNFKDKADKYGAFKVANGKPIGLSQEAYDYFKQSSEPYLAASAFAYINSYITHIEEQKVLLGSTALYKNLEDEYKRLSTQSSTGNVMIVDQNTNAYIEYVNARDSKEIFNPKTGKVESFNYTKPAGKFSEIITEEYDKYVSDLTVIKPDLISPITGKETNTIRFIYETNLIKTLKPFLLSKNKTEAQANKIISDQTDLYEEKYQEVNENDGQSHITIFADREYQHRAGSWTKEKENNFQLQLKALTLKDSSELKDLSVYVDKATKKTVKAYVSNTADYVLVKPFDFADIQEKLDLNGNDWFTNTFEASTPLKGQYVGPVELGVDNLNVVGIRKTSYFVLQPTIVLGTNLQLLNTLMIQDGIDLHHFASSAKTGRLDAKVVNPDLINGLQFYAEDGSFNYDTIKSNVGLMKSYLDVRFMKDQLKINNYVKYDIKNSTQSAKIILSNITSDGVPRDVPEHLIPLFKEADEAGKRNMSEFYRLISDYKDVFSTLIERNIDNLKRELEVAESESGLDIGNFDSLVRLLTQAAQDRNATVATLEAIEKFAESKVIEMLPNKSKIENILFSIVSNRIINFKRPGSSYAQASITGFEDIGSRELHDDKPLNNSTLKFYSPEITDGNITGVNPAEIAMPLPDKWFKYLLNRYDTTNIQEAIDKYNADPLKILVKGLRIPNQQLSSNDIFAIKTFYVPTMETFVVIPSEMVVKSGGDFDIDKLNIYFPPINARTLSDEERYTKFISEQANDKDIAEEVKEELKKTSNRSWANFKGRINKNKESYKELKDEFFEMIKEYPKSIKNTVHTIMKEGGANFYQKIDSLNRVLEYEIENITNQDISDRPELTVLLTDYRFLNAMVLDFIKDVESLEEAKNELYERGKNRQKELWSELSMKIAKERALQHDLMSWEDFQKLPEAKRLSKQELQTKLIDIEKELLLHPDNLHNLLKPLVDDKLKVQTLSEVVGQLKQGLSKVDAIEAANKGDLTGKTKSDDINDVVTNIAKFILYIETKAGVGMIATDITGHSIAQADNIRVSEQFTIGQGESAITYSNRLPFEGSYDFSLSRYFDENGYDILEGLSVALTSQVDGEKNPYATKLGLSNQTLGILTYLMRRGVPVETIIKFLSQPILENYLLEQRLNESQVMEVNRLNKSKKDLLEAYLLENKISKKDYDLALDKARAGNLVLSTEKLENNIRNGINDVEALAVFNNLIDITRAFRYYKADLTPDTKTLKDMAAANAVKDNEGSMYVVGFIENPNASRQGVLAAFFKARDLYKQLYNKLYMTENFRYAPNLKSMIQQYAAIKQTEDDKVKVGNTITNQLLAYIVQNHHPLFKDKTFGQLFTGENSLPRRINSILLDNTHPLYNNYALKNMYVELKNVQDIVSKQEIDNIRIYERSLPVIALNDIYEVFYELPQDLQDDFLAMSIYQTGFNTSPYSFEAILPVDRRFEVVEEALALSDSMNFDDFYNKYALNNIEDLPKTEAQAFYNKFPYYTRWSEEGTKVYRLRNSKKETPVEIQPLGNAYYKRYNTSEVVLPQAEVEEYTEFEEVDVKSTSNKPKFYTGKITTSPDTIFVFGSNPEGRHGLGAAKTARDEFGAIYGQGEGLQGNSYALPTKDLRVKANNSLKSIDEKTIINSIKKLYTVARANPTKQFKVAYTNTTDRSLNGYTGLEMIEMFNKAGERPDNIVFSEEWFKTGKLLGTNESTSVNTNAADYTNYSGAATGSDTYWEQVGKEYGIGKQVNYITKDIDRLTEAQKQEVEKAYVQAVKDLGRKTLPIDSYSGKLVRRDYLQAKAGDAVFAIVEGFDVKEDPTKSPNTTDITKSVKSYRFTPKGGTGYATLMATRLGKPVYIFDQSDGKWYDYSNRRLVEIDTPVLTTKFAGIGTRQLNDKGKQAIRDVYEKTFGQVKSTPSIIDVLESKGVEVEDIRNSSTLVTFKNMEELTKVDTSVLTIQQFDELFPDNAYLSEMEKQILIKGIGAGQIEIVCKVFSL